MNKNDTSQWSHVVTHFMDHLSREAKPDWLLQIWYRWISRQAANISGLGLRFDPNMVACPEPLIL
jgi:hypothetical protein